MPERVVADPRPALLDGRAGPDVVVVPVDRRDCPAALGKRIAAIEIEISSLEDEAAKLNAEMALPSVAGDYAKFQELSSKVLSKQAQIQKLYQEWDTKSAEL